MSEGIRGNRGDVWVSDRGNIWMSDIGWTMPSPLHVQRYILRDRGNKTWAVVDNRTREVLATDLTLLAAEGMLKLLEEG